MGYKLLEEDRVRQKKIPPYQKYYRLSSKYSKRSPLGIIYRVLLRFWCRVYCAELHANTPIGGGLYIGHPYGITINPRAILGRNINIHKGVTIGQENRGKRKGVPQIGNNVWIGVNSTIVGNITIGDDVLIAPNTYVNCDIPSHSVVIGCPCVIKHRENATEGYINNRV